MGCSRPPYTLKKAALFHKVKKFSLLKFFFDNCIYFQAIEKQAKPRTKSQVQ